jgi:hypothetical protein
VSTSIGDGTSQAKGDIAQLDPAKQAAFIKSYEALLNRLSADEATVFVDAVHPTHATRPVGCWAPKDIPVAIT